MTHMAELGIRPDVIEVCLNHISGTRARSRELTTDRNCCPSAAPPWKRALHIEGLVTGATANVVPLRRQS